METTEDLNPVLPEWAQSSVDPKKLSTMIEGILTAISALVILAASHFGLSISQDQYTQVVANISQTVSAAAAVWGVIQAVRGGGRKILMRSIRR
jgi:hypothetical protein